MVYFHLVAAITVYRTRPYLVTWYNYPYKRVLLEFHNGMKDGFDRLGGSGPEDCWQFFFLLKFRQPERKS